jgi:Fic family protein
MSAEIRQRRKGYYDILEKTQKGDLDITAWLTWFLDCLGGAISRSEDELQIVLTKARFWEELRDATLNERQRMMLNRLLDGFDGKLTSSKWAQIAKCSQDTALRDIEALISMGVLDKEPGGGRSTSYALSGRNTAHAQSMAVAKSSHAAGDQAFLDAISIKDEH